MTLEQQVQEQTADWNARNAAHRTRNDAQVQGLVDALRWYEEHATNCRKFGNVGDQARHNLDADGGQRARRALAAWEGQQ